MPAVHPLEALERALNAERRALLEHDADALLSSTAAKLAALDLRQAAAALGLVGFENPGEIHVNLR